MANRVTIDEAVCKGCGLCVVTCPKHVLELSAAHINAKGYSPATVKNINGCIACGMCAIICPDSAIGGEKEDVP
jgi:2-oxoglutarate ferredoxin oxidoreductase subunit delta